jgi:hypothetical protein
MHVADPEILQPAQQGLPALAIVSEDLGAAACAPVSATSNFCLAMSIPSQAKPVISMYSINSEEDRRQSPLFVNLVRRVRDDPPQDTVRSDQQSMGERG